MKKPVTRVVRTFHVWSGLTIGAFFCVICASGSALIFRQPIEEWFRPAWATKSSQRPKMILTAAAANVSRQWPDYRISGITLPEREGAPLEVTVRIDGEHSLRAFVDARSGEVLGTYRLGWMAWISSLHHRLLLPDDIARTGQQTIGWFGIVLFLVSLSGLSIWVLRGARWARIFGARRGIVRRFTAFDLHRTVGVLGNFLAVVRLTHGNRRGVPPHFRCCNGRRRRGSAGSPSCGFVEGYAEP